MNGKTYKIAVYYIATGKYKDLFSEFLESLQIFFPSYKKVVMLMSDGLDRYHSYINGNVSVKMCPKINDYPWPIVALYKMWHISQNIDESYEFSCYFNANAIIYKHSENVFDLNKITVSYHSFNSKNRIYNPWPHISINRDSTAYLENETYEYIQSGFFFGPTKIIKKMCDDVNRMLQNDINIQIIAQWHDESYLNKWCELNKNLVDKKYIMTVYKEEIDENRFIYLRNKKDYDIKKN